MNLCELVASNPQMRSDFVAHWDMGTRNMVMAARFGMSSGAVSRVARSLGLPSRRNVDPEPHLAAPTVMDTPRKCLCCGASFMSPYPKAVTRICPTCAEEI